MQSERGSWKCVRQKSVNKQNVLTSFIFERVIQPEQGLFGDLGIHAMIFNVFLESRLVRLVAKYSITSNPQYIPYCAPFLQFILYGQFYPLSTSYLLPAPAPSPPPRACTPSTHRTSKINSKVKVSLNDGQNKLNVKYHLKIQKLQY